jgi:hypothetical protein
MAKTNEKKQAGQDQGNAVESETHGIDPIEEIIRRNAEPSVSEEDAEFAAEHPDGGESGGKKY